MNEEIELNGFSQDDLARMSDMYVRGENIHKIANELNLSDVEILRGLQLVYDSLQKAVPFMFDNAMIMQLSKLDKAESEAWKAWDSSKEAKVKKSSKATKVAGKRKKSSDEDNDGDGNMKPDSMEQSQVTEQRDGSPAFLGIVVNCVRTRLEILRLK